MTSQKLASYISIILGPHVWLPLMLIATLARSGVASYKILLIFPFLFLILVIAPLAYLYFAVKFGLTSSWDLPHRRDRYYFLAICLFVLLISVVVAYPLGNQLLFHLSLLIFVLLTILSLITTFWQISLHASLNTAGIILLGFLFGWQLLYLIILLPIIYWARLTLHRHNILQLLAGSLVSSAILIAGLRLFGYL